MRSWSRSPPPWAAAMAGSASSSRPASVVRRDSRSFLMPLRHTGGAKITKRSRGGDVYGGGCMAMDPSVVTVSGPDRAALLTDLTLRFGRIDVVSEREVVLPGGTRGFELTVRHRPFIDDLQGGEPAPPTTPPAPEPPRFEHPPEPPPESAHDEAQPELQRTQPHAYQELVQPDFEQHEAF